MKVFLVGAHSSVSLNLDSILYKVFQNGRGIVVGFDNLSVLNFDAY
jgi:hypothetical protein